MAACGGAMICLFVAPWRIISVAALDNAYAALRRVRATAISIGRALACYRRSLPLWRARNHRRQPA
jgi:hypothetical protein